MARYSGSTSARRQAPGARLPVIVFVATPEAYEGGIQSVADIAGHKIGVDAVGGGFHYPSVLAAKKYGFEIPLSDIVPLNAPPNIASSIQAKALEVGVVAAFNGQTLEDAGEARILGWVGDETPYAFAALFTSKKVIEDRRDVLVRAVRAIMRGAKLYNAAFAVGADNQIVFKDRASEIIDMRVAETGRPRALVEATIVYIESGLALDLDGIARRLRTGKHWGWWTARWPSTASWMLRSWLTLPPVFSQVLAGKLGRPSGRPKAAVNL